jgi:L-threonylcarbamoyladenylate synthase
MSALFPSSDQFKHAATLLREGQLVAFPTETVYGLGADATNETAVRAIFAAKGRPSNNPLIVHVATFEDLLLYTDTAKAANPNRLRSRLEDLRCLFPGPLSVVVPKSNMLCAAVSAGSPTVALRIPRHPVALRLITECGRPIAAPSANPSNYISPTTAQHVRDGLGASVACILDGGSCAIGIESTVLSLVIDEPTILRPGAVTADELERILGCPVRRALGGAESETAPLLSPGLLAKHYAPHTPVRLLTGLDPQLCRGLKVGAIVFSKDTALPANPQVVLTLSERGALEEVAAKLFAALRELDASGVELILVDSCEPIGLGAAIMDRLLRATHR